MGLGDEGARRGRLCRGGLMVLRRGGAAGDLGSGIGVRRGAVFGVRGGTDLATLPLCETAWRRTRGGWVAESIEIPDLELSLLIEVLRAGIIGDWEIRGRCSGFCSRWIEFRLNRNLGIAHWKKMDA